MEPSRVIRAIREKADWSAEQFAHLLGTSVVSLDKWERGSSAPSPALFDRLQQIHALLNSGADATALAAAARSRKLFSAKGLKAHPGQGVLGEGLPDPVRLAPEPLPPILSRLSNDGVYLSHVDVLEELWRERMEALTASSPITGGMSAGKNTYTYDAHTYHTKVPPQGIAEVLTHYLPNGGLVLDPFAGSGMTGVAARVCNCDVVLNELSPAASFIASRFISPVSPSAFEAAVSAILSETRVIRQTLYSTQCRECGRETELLYVVWSYRVVCHACQHEFTLWDHCREYGETVKDHKILSEFSCPKCNKKVKKSRLKRTYAVPVEIGYKCCGSKQKEANHPPSPADRDLISSLEMTSYAAEGFFPQCALPDGVNLNQPKKHGLVSVDKFYTARNLAAMSHLWRAIHRVPDVEIAAQLAFTFTSLYQRVTRLSEFRFWGGSGNTARFNVPYIFNESNVFVTFARKARSIRDHLQTTAATYSGRAAVINGSATKLALVPDNTVDFVFTDPPFGANINYSDMNFLWESWLGAFTDTTDEAIVNRVQGKSTTEYEDLMRKSLLECFRVLRPGHWLLLMFMNSSRDVWYSLRNAIFDAGFEIRHINTFDKQHGTFKQFVSDNAAGMDLVLHCLKPANGKPATRPRLDTQREANANLLDFLRGTNGWIPTNVFLHVGREQEIDFRTLYSEWVAQSFVRDAQLVDFHSFRKTAEYWLSTQGGNEAT